VLLNTLAHSPTLSRHRVLAAWLFGSEGRGDAGPGSDVDVGVLCDPPLGVDRPVVMDELAAALGREVDVIDMAVASPTLVWEVITSGRIVREDDSFALERFLRRARYDAEDADQRNRMIVLAQAGRLGNQVR
jgi:predicted nucleotidyltransferase